MWAQLTHLACAAWESAVPAFSTNVTPDQSNTASLMASAPSFVALEAHAAHKPRGVHQFHCAALPLKAGPHRVARQPRLRPCQPAPAPQQTVGQRRLSLRPLPRLASPSLHT